MSVVEGLKIQIHVCGTYVLSVWFTLLIGFGSVWIFSRDLIEAFKIIRGFVDYGQNLFKLSISGLNILSKITKDTTSDRRDFFSERILKYWNILPKMLRCLKV